MKVNRHVVENELYTIIEEFNNDKKVIEKIEEDLLSRNMNKGEILGILNNNIPLESIADTKLFLLTQAFYRVIENEVINPTRFYSDLEIEENKNLQLNVDKEDDVEKLIFKDVLQIDDDDFSLVLTYQKIVDLYNKGLVNYNKETQRQPKYMEYKNKLIIKPFVNFNAVNEISDLMDRGMYVSDEITFNILKTGDEFIKYNDRTKQLEISGTLDVIDGFHRSLAIIKTVVKNPEINKSMPVRITNFDIDKAKRFIYQKNQINKIPKRYEQQLNPVGNEIMIVKMLNENPKSELQGKITTDASVLNRGYAWVLSDIITDAIKYNFGDKLKAKKDIDRIGEYLIEGFNEIIALYYEEFHGNIVELRKKSVLSNSAVFIGYATLLNYLQGKDNWKQKLNDVLKDIDFNINNPVWKDLDIFETNLNKRQISKIINYFLRLL